ncbi:porin [Litoricolaceae bacterium]|nr:porin [Litorivicinaceae bacterium]
MKKIIALAVASAFAVPALAADVTVSGDVEYMYIDADAGSAFNSGDQDITVSASEEIGDGLSVAASLEVDGDSDTATAGMQSDSSLTISGSNFSIAIGDAVGAASESFDEVSDKAEQGGTSGETLISTEHSLLLTVTPADGVTVAVSTGSVDDSVTATSYTVNSYAVQFNVMGATIAYGIADNENNDKNINTMSVSYSAGPVSIGYDSISNVGYVDKDDQTNVGVAYAYGNGNLFVESGELKDDSASTSTETTAVGASYKLGPVNLYALRNSVKTTTTDHQTYIGVEYAF